MSKKSLIIPVLFIASCTVGPDYKRPEVKTSSSFFSLKNFLSKNKKQENPPQIAENIDQKWWGNFDDPILNQIIDLVISENLDLKVAESKIAEARANLRKQVSALAPQVDLGASATRSSKIFNPMMPNRNKPINIFDAGFDVSWELDLFGAVRRADESFTAIFEATKEDRNAIKISLIGEAARNYMQLRNLQNQIEIHQKSIAALEEMERLSVEKNKVGLMSDIDLIKIKTQLLNEKSLIPGLDDDLNSALFRLEVLCGKNPGELSELLKPNLLSIPQINKEVIISAPADVMRNRPDVKEAERNLASATALEGVAIAQRYPRISLTSFLGFQNTESGNLLKRASKVFSVGSAGNIPIFDFGGIKADIKASQARKEQALLSYKSSILKALEDIENALVSYSNSQEKLEIAAKNLEVNRLSIKLMEDKYQRGLISMPDLLSAKLDFYQNHNSLIQSQSDLNTSLITLYKALGGGWDTGNDNQNKES